MSLDVLCKVLRECGVPVEPIIEALQEGVINPELFDAVLQFFGYEGGNSVSCVEFAASCIPGKTISLRVLYPEETPEIVRVALVAALAVEWNSDDIRIEEACIRSILDRIIFQLVRPLPKGGIQGKVGGKP